jgi:V/A-type H+/Na+-transporting ATPase subunit F
MSNYPQTFKVISGENVISYVIGDVDMVTGFRLVGVDGAEVSTVEEAKQALDKVLLRSEVGIIVISQEFLSDTTLNQEIDKIRQERVSPLIVEIPGSKGSFKEIQLSDIISKILGIKV